MQGMERYMLVHYRRLTYRYDMLHTALAHVTQSAGVATSKHFTRNRVHLVTADNYMRLTSNSSMSQEWRSWKRSLWSFRPEFAFLIFQYQYIRNCFIELFAAALFLDRCELYDSSSHLCGIN
jgi:hypothetical protein